MASLTMIFQCSFPLKETFIFHYILPLFMYGSKYNCIDLDIIWIYKYLLQVLYNENLKSKIGMDSKFTLSLIVGQ